MKRASKVYNTVLRVALGLLASLSLVAILWIGILESYGFPRLREVTTLLVHTFSGTDTYLAALATLMRVIAAILLGSGLAFVASILTGRTKIGWIFLFFALFFLQKIPAVALMHLFMLSSIGIGTAMTIILGSTVVFSFTWIVLHQRAKEISSRNLHIWRVNGFSSFEILLYGIIPYMASAMLSASRMAVSIALVIVVLGETQGVWNDGSIWARGIGVEIGRSYELPHSQAHVVAWCVWLGLIGLMLDAAVITTFVVLRKLTGIDFSTRK